MDIVLCKTDLVKQAIGKPLSELTWTDFRWYCRDAFTVCNKAVIQFDGEEQVIIKDRGGFN